MRWLLVLACLFSLSLPFAFAQEQNQEGYTEEVSYEAPPPRGGITKALQLPEISIIGNLQTLFSSNKEEEGRNQVRLKEVELALQSYIYPTIRGDVILCTHEEMENGERHSHTHVEEGYVSFLNLGKGFQLFAGRMRIGFGKENRIHPHHRLYVDNPLVLTNFFSEEGLIGDGATLAYLIPAKRFLRLDLSTWQVVSPSQGTGLPGLEKTLHTARLWTSSQSAKGELESGVSFGKGSGDNAPKVYGFDITYKRWPGAFGRDILRSEVIWGKGRDGDTRRGFYILGTHKFTKYWEGGFRLDNTQLVTGGTGKAFSLFASNYLTETTFLRFQYQYRDLPSGNDNLFWVQVVFGMGPHAHPIE